MIKKVIRSYKVVKDVRMRNTGLGRLFKGTEFLEIEEEVCRDFAQIRKRDRNCMPGRRRPVYLLEFVC